MTFVTSALDSRASTSLPGAKNRQPHLREIAFQGAALLIAFAVPTIAAAILDDRRLNDVSVWDKPLKFEASLAVHLVTLGILASLLTPAWGEKRLVRWAYLGSALAAIGELAYIVLQAARGRSSHFNFGTPIEAAMYGVMGFGAIILVVCAFIIGLAIARGSRPETGAGLKTGAAWGLMLGAAATLVTAGIMSAGLLDAPGHWIGGVRSDAHGLPLAGWSSTGGDLRVPHFFATHLMQALPLLGFVADRWLPGQAHRIVWAGACLGVLAVLFAFFQAALGMPLIRI
jgi:hypothetical protein